MKAILHHISATSILLLSLSAVGATAGVYPLPDVDDIEYPDDEPPTQRQVALGKVLFFDPRLSENNNRSAPPATTLTWVLLMV